MPTGYTARVEDGTVTEFKDFALMCAHAFLYEMRDHGLDAKIAEEVKPNDYHDREMRRWCAKVEELRSMTANTALKVAVEEWQKSEASNVDCGKKWDVENARYSAMRAKVADWIPPTKDHEEMKRFMLEQLQISMRSDELKSYVKSKPKPTDGAAWLRAEIAYAEKQIEYHRVEYHKDIARAEQRNSWVKALRESLR